MNSAQNVIGELRKLGIPIDISPNKLLPGYGEGVCSVLFALAEMSISNKIRFKKPIIRDDGGGFGGDDDAEELGDELEGEMRKRRQELRALTSQFSRPEKTQTAQQWNAIAQWSLEIAKALGCSIDAIDGILRSRFGSSGIPNLRAALAKKQ